MVEAGQGEVWDCGLDPIAGHEQAGRRPCLVISVDQIGRGASELAIVVPITRSHVNRLDVEINPPEGGLTDVSYALPYQIRTISRERLLHRCGVVRRGTLDEVFHRIQLIIKPA